MSDETNIIETADNDDVTEILEGPVFEEDPTLLSFEDGDAGLEDDDEAPKATGLLAAGTHMPRGHQSKKGKRFTASDMDLEDVAPKAVFWIRPAMNNDAFSQLIQKASRKYPNLVSDWSTQQAVFPTIYAATLLSSVEFLPLLIDSQGNPLDTLEAVRVYQFPQGSTDKKVVKDKPVEITTNIKFALDDDGCIVDTRMNRQRLLTAIPSISSKVFILANEADNFRGMTIDVESKKGN